ncbi:MAG: 50S ribosomal protein L5 [Anaerolineae bacterium CG_4_9_14_3_um_filter_57_17]|nr:50S ribosomal protein L5 [bacterium]NCT20902.1 50S ribosomal protein L5 [bacterium]OIO85027.1 MAG: 50S ribosomal protein L5 [Anaerolineae bacterium CG2_30_57_67]PJB68051.1 MAG: 50S ribosomal protein L5 [Anaerolineae bacterium CG_4_9_14_3_um_filter_57_17]
MNRLKERYLKEVVPALNKAFQFRNAMEVPRIQKVVVNIGLGEAMDNSKVMEAAVGDITTITGQKPIQTKARKSIANFKLREGHVIGVKVTLRGERMWSFLDRVLSIALPRVRDFRGVSPDAFDGRGNYTLGLRDQLIFPEIEYDKIDKLRGMEITIVTTAQNDEHSRAMLKFLGMPFRKDA